MAIIQRLIRCKNATSITFHVNKQHECLWGKIAKKYAIHCVSPLLWHQAFTASQPYTCAFRCGWATCLQKQFVSSTHQTSVCSLNWYCLFNMSWFSIRIWEIKMSCRGHFLWKCWRLLLARRLPDFSFLAPFFNGTRATACGLSHAVPSV